ncbi:MAG: hypothetical protein Q8K93_16955, partial [Reyranella sp.]|nr:hypothetical protein [Reyranella sp.]
WAAPMAADSSAVPPVIMATGSHIVRSFRCLMEFAPRTRARRYQCSRGLTLRRQSLREALRTALRVRWISDLWFCVLLLLLLLLYLVGGTAHDRRGRHFVCHIGGLPFQLGCLAFQLLGVRPEPLPVLW